MCQWKKNKFCDKTNYLVFEKVFGLKKFGRMWCKIMIVIVLNLMSTYTDSGYTISYWMSMPEPSW